MHPMRRLLAAVIVGAVLPLASAAEPLRVGVAYDYPPYVDRAAPGDGMAIAIIREAAARTGLRIAFIERPWSRAKREVATGELFATGPWADTAKRRAQFRLSAPLFHAQDFPFVRRDADHRIRRLSDLAGLSVCRPHSYGLFDLEGLAADGVVTVEQPGSMSACFAMLARGRVDVVWADQFEGFAAAVDSGAGPATLRMDPHALLTTGMHLLVHQRWPEVEAILAGFDRALADMRMDGTHARIRRAYHTTFEPSG